jgi:hypothetical protein
MKSCQFLLCILATTNAIANTSDLDVQLAHFSFAASAFQTDLLPAQAAPIASRVRGADMEQANFADFSGGVVGEMRATSIIVQNHVAKARISDDWLIALVALGLVILQLRRKHKSLPQRWIAP